MQRKIWGFAANASGLRAREWIVYHLLSLAYPDKSATQPLGQRDAIRCSDILQMSSFYVSLFPYRWMAARMARPSATRTTALLRLPTPVSWTATRRRSRPPLSTASTSGRTSSQQMGETSCQNHDLADWTICKQFQYSPRHFGQSRLRWGRRLGHQRWELNTRGESMQWDINSNFRAEIGGGGERAQEPHQDADLALPKAELRSLWDITCWIKSTGWSPERIAASQVRECYFCFTDTQIQCLSHSLVSRSLRRNQIKYRSFKRMRVAYHVPYLNEKQ